ncbi:MAG: HD domain-containing protein, partial [Proteobacteria bacterium]|nr:HD domain-containing protein [Pseudomonadota bacterium]
EQKANIPIEQLDRTRSTPLIQAWYEIVHLKHMFRQGWLKRGVPRDACETVAEHTFGNAMLCLLLLADRPELDGYKVLRLALVHDLGEAYVGDITPHDNVDRADKIRMETAAVREILDKLPNGASLIADWDEYEAQQSAEARFVKEIDRMELALQASVYDQRGLVDATEFYDAVTPTIKSADLKVVLQALRGLSQEQKRETE